VLVALVKRPEITPGGERISRGNHTQLLKHFRGYKELISYSNVNFYRRSLQAMKIRAKPIDEVIRFTQLQSTQALGPRNINQAEIDFIMGELTKLKAGTR
jgi:hypothetical protein